MTLYERIGKRVVDVAVAGAALVATAPILGLAAAAIKLDSEGPVLFVQDRMGLRGRPFRVLKLRTMTHVQRESGPGREVSLDDPEVTRIGRFLRRTKIDELPQLVNVLKGDMSVVGPRPGLLRMAEQLDGFG
ncbi:MAG: sugar transferase, partial [Myxococcota bacterium]